MNSPPLVPNVPQATFEQHLILSTTQMIIRLSYNKIFLLLAEPFPMKFVGAQRAGELLIHEGAGQ